MATLVKKISGIVNNRILVHQIKQIFDSSSCRVARSFSQSASLLSGRRYSEKHEWIVVDGKNGTVGVSHYAQEALGDVVFVQTPEVGQVFVKEDEAGVIESVKAVNEIYTPVSGKVTEINDLLVDQPSLINDSCYDKGWIFKIELSDLKEVDALMEEDAYQKYLKSIH